MGVKERKTYLSVPPPPLPEFYEIMKSDDKQRSSSSSSAAETKKTVKVKEIITSTDGTYDGKPGWVPPIPLGTISPLPQSNDVPPLAVYHICRICLRPRSPRYHREHPIPINGVPPPPGICRRCRVMSVEEVQGTTELVMESESAPVKIGFITPFVPDKDIISNEEMRRMKVEKYLNGRPDDRRAARHRRDSRKDIVYPHVKVVDAPSADESDDEEEEVVEEVIEEVTLPRKKKAVFTSRETVNSEFTAPTPERPRVVKATTSMQVQPTEYPPSVTSNCIKFEDLRKMDSTKASVAARASSSSQCNSASTVRASAKASAQPQPRCTESDVRKVAREEIEQYAKAMQQPQQRHQEIREIARAEVERYRQAERKIEAHPDAFAHGKLVPVEHRVPVERRIDVERDSAAPMPWVPPAQDEESVTKVSSKATTSRSAARDFAYEPASDHANDKSRSAIGSSGPRWDREVSVEQHSRRESNPRIGELRKDSTAVNTKSSSQKEDWEYEAHGSTRSREVYGHFRGSKASQGSLKNDPKASDKRSEDKYEIIGVIEERDLPSRSRTTSYRRHDYASQPPPKPDPPVPERVQELRAGSNASQAFRGNSTASKQAERPQQGTLYEFTTFVDVDDWGDEATARTTCTRSTKQSGYRAAANSEPAARTLSPVVERSTHASTHSRVTFQDDKASDKTRWTAKQRIAEEGRAGPTGPGKRLPYPEDNVMPDPSDSGGYAQADKSQPKSSQHKKFTTDPDREYLYIERTVQPADRRRGSRPFVDHPPKERVEMEETYIVRRRPEGEEKPRRRRRGRNEQPMRESDDSHHVKFNKKVEISPTPPDSDASSSEFRSFQSIGPRGGRQIDGNDDHARKGDIVGEYERRGRTRSRDGKIRHFHDQEIIYEGADDEWIVKPQGGSKKGGANERQAAWVPGGVPLQRPLSESPSREELVSSSRHSKSNSRGPYREQTKVTDSTQAQDGSPGGRACGNGVGGSMHSSIGQAAQVFW